MSALAVRSIVVAVLLAAHAATASPDESERLELEWAGCEEVLAPADDPTCVLTVDDPSLRLWARAATGRPAIARGARADEPPEPIQGGWLWRLHVEPGASSVVLHAPSGDGGGDDDDGFHHGLRIAWREPAAVLDEVHRLETTDRAEARRLLRAALRDLSRSGAAGDPDRAVALRARLAFRLATLDERPEHAAALFRQAAGLSRRAGYLRGRIHALTRLHHVLYSALDDPVGAQEALDALPDPPVGDATSSLVAALFRAPWNIRLGRLRTALRDLEEAERRALRLDDPLLLYARQPQTFLASRLGLHARALELADWLRPRADRLADPCRRSDLFTDLAWSQILILESSAPGRQPDPIDDLRQAARLAADCGSFQQANTAINLALGHLHAGRIDQARRALAASDDRPSTSRSADERDPSSPLEPWRWEVTARIALADGRAAEALALYRAMGARATDGETRWRSAVGRAQALRRLGRIDEALAAFAEAETLLDTTELRVPLVEPGGPESAFVFFARGSRQHLDLLVETGRAARALEVARRSRRRAVEHLARVARADSADAATRAARQRHRARFDELRSALDALRDEEAEAPTSALDELAERRRRLTLEQEVMFAALDADPARGVAPLATPRPGELLLVFHPSPDGWIGLAALDGAVVARRLTGPQDPSTLLEPFADAIRRAESLRILPYGPLERVAFHALPFGDGILLDRLPVVYGLDLPPAAEPPRDSTRRAVVVEDPSRSLRHASTEAAEVARRLRRAGWAARALAAGEATPGTVRDALERPGLDLFHWAGHVEPYGDARSDPGLVFDRGRRLRAADLLTLERAPPRVVLSSCSALPGTLGDGAVGLGLGQTLLLAGAHWVLGPTGPVDDRDAAELTSRFVRAWLAELASTSPAATDADATDADAAAVALRRTLLELRRERPESGWRHVRLSVR